MLVQSGVVLLGHAQRHQLVEGVQGVGFVQLEVLCNGFCAAHQGEEPVGAFPDSAQLPIHELYFNPW